MWQDAPMQCWMLICQVNADEGRATPWESVAEPWKLITSPTAKVVEDVGDEIVGTGAPAPPPQVMRALAQSAWSKSMLSPPLVTTSWSWALPVRSRLICL